MTHTVQATQATELFLEAAQANRDDPLVSGSTIAFPDYGQLVMTGDLHGHRRNFEKLQRYCNLASFGARHVILHELIHEESASLAAQDDSHFVLFDAARWKCEHPDQIHFLLSNHELAQISRNEITKNGRVVTMDFEQSVAASYGDGASDVLDAMYSFIRSFPLAGRTHNRVFLSHSLPAARELPTFDSTVLDRNMSEDDLAVRGSAHAMVWGRYHTRKAIDMLRDILDVDYFICGHQPQDDGFDVLHDRMIIIASDHNHGVFLPFDLKKPVSLKSLTGNIRPFAGVA